MRHLQLQAKRPSRSLLTRLNKLKYTSNPICVVAYYIRALNLVLLSYLVILMQDKELETKENII